MCRRFVVNQFLIDSCLSFYFDTQQPVIDPLQVMRDWPRNGDDDGFSGFYINKLRYRLDAVMTQALSEHVGVAASTTFLHYMANEARFASCIHKLNSSLLKLIITTAHQAGLFGFIGHILGLLILYPQGPHSYSVEKRKKQIFEIDHACIQVQEIAVLNHRFSPVVNISKPITLQLTINYKVSIVDRGALPVFSDWQFLIEGGCQSEVAILQFALQQLNVLLDKPAPMFTAVDFYKQIDDEIMIIKQHPDLLLPAAELGTPETVRKVFATARPTPPRRPCAEGIIKL